VLGGVVEYQAFPFLPGSRLGADSHGAVMRYQERKVEPPSYIRKSRVRLDVCFGGQNRETRGAAALAGAMPIATIDILRIP
jgi:hypothetical protein